MVSTAIATPSTTAQRLSAVVDELSVEFLERASVVRALVVAMLAGQHSFILGPPGTAKSELARALTGRIEGAGLWEILLGKFTDPKTMFGPIDVVALMEGRYTQVFEGRATTAHIAFIDEIFKCSSGALNATLALLNERLYHPENGGAPIRCPLISAITASNELPSGEETAAIYDRLLVRIEVEYLQDPSNFAALLRTACATVPPLPPTTVDLAALQHAATTEVPATAVPDGILDAVCQLRTQLRRQELAASDRRWKWSVGLLQASAYLDGRAEVNDKDLAILTTVLWDKTTDRPAVEREVLSLVNPDAKEALDLLDAIDELEAELDGKAGQSREALSQWAIKEANHKLVGANSRLADMRGNAVAAGRSTDTLDTVIARCRAVYARVMVEACGINPTMVQGLN